MRLRKAVIPAAGFGTRMLPAAKAVAKELLPVLDRPTMQYVIEEAAEGGLNEAILVTAAGKESIEAHFRENVELEERLRATGKSGLLESVRQLAARVKISSVIQKQQRGLGDAVYQGKEAVGEEAFVCLLGDTIFSGSPLPTKQLVEAYGELGTAIIGLEEVAAEKVSRYGIVGGTRVREGVWKLDTIVEKPTVEAAPSRLAVAARYVLTPGIFGCLEKTPMGKGGEVQLTDAIRLLMEREPVHGVVLKAKRHDIGNPVDWLKTNLVFARRDAKLWREIEPLLRDLLHRPQ
jgi:UTP--glucose-1-phosphate uridylyltransferase